MFTYFGAVERFSLSIQSYVYLFIYIAGGIRGNKEVKINKKRQIRFVRDNSSNLIKNMSVLWVQLTRNINDVWHNSNKICYFLFFYVCFKSLFNYISQNMLSRLFVNGSNGSLHLMENFECKYFKYPLKLIINKVTEFTSVRLSCMVVWCPCSRKQ